MGFFQGAKRNGQCYDSDGLDSFASKAVEGLCRLFEPLLVIAQFFEARQVVDFYLAAIVNEDFSDIPSIDMDREDHGISMREQSEIHILGGEGYGHVGQFGLSDGAFDNYMIYFSIVISTLSFGVEISVRTARNCEDCAMGGEGFRLLRGFLDL
jgi:hypothetical protein